MIRKILFRAGVIIGSYVLVKNSYFYVSEDERAVIFDRFKGAKDTTVGAGYHFRTPLVEYPLIFKINPPSNISKHTTTTIDAKNVSVQIEIAYRPSIDNLPNLYRNFGRDYAEIILPSVSHDAVKSTISKHTTQDLISKKDQVSNEIREKITQSAKEYFVIVDETKTQIELDNNN